MYWRYEPMQGAVSSTGGLQCCTPTSAGQQRAAAAALRQKKMGRWEEKKTGGYPALAERPYLVILSYLPGEGAVVWLCCVQTSDKDDPDRETATGEGVLRTGEWAASC